MIINSTKNIAKRVQYFNKVFTHPNSINFGNNNSSWIVKKKKKKIKIKLNQTYKININKIFFWI
jgi:hypothetical protein